MLHPQDAALRPIFKKVITRAATWEGVFYRAVGIAYSKRKDLLTGLGAKRHGGRWTPAGQFAAVYGSLEPETALAEALSWLRSYGIPVGQAMPLVIAAVNARWQAVLDLTDPAIDGLFPLLNKDAAGSNWRTRHLQGEETLTQTIGRIAWEFKLGGLLVPSAPIPNARNIVLFPGRRRHGDSLRIQRVHHLPR